MNLLTLEDGTNVDLSYAEKVIKDMKYNVITNKRRNQNISTSKLRKLLEPINTLYTQVHHDPNRNLSTRVIEELEYIKVRFIYESGRDDSVKTFIEQSYLHRLLEKVIESGTKRDFIHFCRYFEALVAYAKFHGMRED